jgi:glycine cleavage system H lipoate-binding protein
MSILFVLLTFIVIVTANYLWFRPQTVPLAPQPAVRPPAPILTKEQGFNIPKGYAFHPGHTWVMPESREDVRVGLDSFATDLIGNIDHIDVVAPNRWVRQGQRLMTLKAGDVSFDLVAPVEGVIMAINKEVVDDPTLAARDPYRDGWIATIKAPDLATNQKNLMQNSMIAPWMHYSQTRLIAALEKINPALAQDGGTPVSGVLLKIPAELRTKLIADFFLNG